MHDERLEFRELSTMDFRLDEDQIALRDTFRGFCGQQFSLDAVAAREATALGHATWQALTDMGVFGMLLSEADGGFGGGATCAAIVFEQLGAHLATGPLLWTAASALVLDDVAEGASRITGIDSVDVRVGPAGAPFVVEHAAESDTVLVLSTDGVAAVATAALTEAIGGEPLDPLTPALAYASLPQGTRVGNADVAARLRTIGTVLAAAQLVGTAQGALDVATQYALQRHQFGVPIGSFQAVKHILADMYGRVELARAAMYAAAAIFDDPRAGNVSHAASSAKLLAGDAGLANSRAAVQVLGGMGFTWEMLPHYFLKRAWTLEQSFGTSDTHALSLSRALDADVEPTVALWT